jgi:hypothetical protein
MKKLVLFAFSIFMSVGVYAGLPEQDPSVGYLRQEFANGKIPTPADLYGDFRMYREDGVRCIFYSAVKNSKDTFHFQARFYSFGKLLRTEVFRNSYWYSGLSRDFGVDFTEYGLIAHAGFFQFRLWRSYRPVYIQYRVTNDPEPWIVGEMFVMEENMAYEARNELEGSMVQAVTHPRGYTFGYFACQ